MLILGKITVPLILELNTCSPYYEIKRKKEHLYIYYVYIFMYTHMFTRAHTNRNTLTDLLCIQQQQQHNSIVRQVESAVCTPYPYLSD